MDVYTNFVYIKNLAFNLHKRRKVLYYPTKRSYTSHAIFTRKNYIILFMLTSIYSLSYLNDISFSISKINSESVLTIFLQRHKFDCFLLIYIIIYFFCILHNSFIIIRILIS